MNKLLWILAVCLVMCSGCVTASYNAQTKEIKYARMGDQKAKGIHLKMPDGTSIEVESMDNSGFAAALSAVTAAFEAGVKAGTGAK